MVRKFLVVFFLCSVPSIGCHSVPASVASGISVVHSNTKALGARYRSALNGIDQTPWKDHDYALMEANERLVDAIDRWAQENRRD